MRVESGFSMKDEGAAPPAIEQADTLGGGLFLTYLTEITRSRSGPVRLKCLLYRALDRPQRFRFSGIPPVEHKC
jgi:hypothetical protein